MRSILTRFAIFGIAGVIAASAIVPASAATRHKRASAQTEMVDPSAPPATRPDWSPIPSAVYQVPNGCFTDEGYGRYTSCELGGF